MTVEVPKSFDDFYRAEVSALIGFLIRCGADSHDAEDACQQAFVNMLPRWAGIARMEQPRAYVRCVALREWQRLVRRPRTDQERAVGGGWLDRAVADAYECPDVATVLGALRGLPTRQREAMAWLYDGYEREEIATHMGIAVSTVRTTIRDARAALRDVLPATGEERFDE